jgi:predicted Zn-dependent protease
MQQLFNDLAAHAMAALRGSEVLLANFAGEATDFVRFNQARVRQPLTVRQAMLTLSLIDGARRDNVTLTLSGDAAADRAHVSAAIERMRAELATLPEDPYLLYAKDAAQSTRETAGALPSPEEAIDAVIAAADGADLVGILASGPVYRGFASSLGARHWHAVDAFLLDWSLYHSTDKAVKSSWAGTHWNRAELAQRMSGAREQLAYLARPPRTIAPGEVRAWLSPAAVDELLSMLSWGGVSHKAQQTKQSCIQKLVDGEATLSPLVTLREDARGGMAPMFDESGFTRPAAVTLVDAGRHAGSMISARTAQEYGIAANGADEDEALSSVALNPGALAQEDVLSALDTGVYVGNLHYLNFSDRAAGRITGLTRFATFWVEGGRIVAPLSVMRFDDTLYRVLGSSLEALGSGSEWMLDSGTYGQRSVRTSRVSGALLSRFALTL